MKKFATILLVLILHLSVNIRAQAPQGVNYQAIALDGSGNPMVNQSVSVRLSILDGSATGTVVYSETQNPSTDNTGLFSIVIGNGTIVSGTFNTINWGSGAKWLKTEIDITGGTAYILMGSSQFMSAPYALYANKAGQGTASFSMPDGFENVTSIVLPNSTDYTVPVGKNLYVSFIQPNLIIDNDTLWTALGSSGADSKNFVGVSAGSIVRPIRDDRMAFLIDKSVEWKTIDLIGTSFTVPNNKQFIIVNYAGTGGFGTCKITLNTTPLTLINFMNVVLDPGSVISTTGCSSNVHVVLNGYFKDK